MYFAPGALVVKAQTANLTNDSDSWGKMDPYVKITLGASTQTTKPAKDMGKTPNWSDILNFRVAGEQSIYVAVFDKDKFSKDEFLGETTIQLGQIFQRKFHSETYNLSRNGQPAGSISIHFEFYPDGQAK